MAIRLNTYNIALALALLGIWTMCACNDDGNTSEAQLDQSALFDLSLEELMEINVIPTCQSKQHSKMTSVNPTTATKPIMTAAKTQHGLTIVKGEALQPLLSYREPCFGHLLSDKIMI